MVWPSKTRIPVILHIVVGVSQRGGWVRMKYKSNGLRISSLLLPGRMGSSVICRNSHAGGPAAGRSPI